MRTRTPESTPTMPVSNQTSDSEIGTDESEPESVIVEQSTRILRSSKSIRPIDPESSSDKSTSSNVPHMDTREIPGPSARPAILIKFSKLKYRIKVLK